LHKQARVAQQHRQGQQDHHCGGMGSMGCVGIIPAAEAVGHHEQQEQHGAQDESGHEQHTT